MRNLITTTAIAALAATPLLAQSSNGLFDHDVEMESGDMYAAAFINRTVYATESEIDDDTSYTADELAAVAEIDDVILSRDGEVKGVVLGVGGFLEMGEKNVLVQFDDLHFVPEEDDDGQYLVVLRTTRDDIEAAPAFEYDDMRVWWES
ncbi:MAG: PRC-barrel domain-containing protein [Pseudomonadota bacterium]